MSAHESLAGFAAAVTGAEAGVPPGVRVARGDLASRFAVYRNNVAVARIGAFADLFPVCRRLVGEDFFADVVRAHLAEAPPRSPIVAEWGADFPAWLAGFAPTRELGWLVDTARLEAAWTRAFHAAEAEPIGLEALGAVSAEELMAARLALHPSLALIASDHPIGSIWAAHQGDDEPEPLALATAETVMVLRPQAEVVVAVIAAADAVWLERLSAGDTLAAATEAALGVDPAFALGPQLVALVRAGAVVGLA